MNSKISTTMFGCLIIALSAIVVDVESIFTTKGEYYTSVVQDIDYYEKKAHDFVNMKIERGEAIIEEIANETAKILNDLRNKTRFEETYKYDIEQHYNRSVIEVKNNNINIEVCMKLAANKTKDAQLRVINKTQTCLEEKRNASQIYFQKIQGIKTKVTDDLQEYRRESLRCLRKSSNIVTAKLCLTKVMGLMTLFFYGDHIAQSYKFVEHLKNMRDISHVLRKQCLDDTFLNTIIEDGNLVLNCVKDQETKTSTTGSYISNKKGKTN